jgi:hypothetical protein
VITASLKDSRHLIQLWLGYTTLSDGLVSGAEEVGELSNTIVKRRMGVEKVVSLSRMEERRERWAKHS